MIEIEALTLNYPGRTALDGISLSVARGEVFGLLGPNGSGKSTLLSILSTLLRPSGGRVLIDGFDVIKSAGDIRRLLGVAFQSPSLDGKLSIQENLRFQGFLFGLHGRELRNRMDFLLERFDLAERRKERVDILSGGLKRRVELAKAMLHKPPLLLLDEPSTGLDPAARQGFWKVLNGLRGEEELTILLATHLMDEAERCGRVALLDNGALVVVGTPNELKAEISDDVVTLETPNPNDLANRILEKFQLKCHVAQEVVKLDGEGGLSAAQKIMEAFPDDVRAVRLGKPSLEDVFMARTGHRLVGETDHP